jgi:hypothetical protein
LLFADLGRSQFLNRLVAALAMLLDRPELSKDVEVLKSSTEQFTNNADQQSSRAAQRNQILAMLELVLQVCLAMAGIY